MAKVFIGVGHGGEDSGAVANGFKEKDLNLKVATFVKYTLDRHGVSTMISRVADISEDLNDKIRRCNAFNPDFAIDVHHNAGGGDGTEAFHHYGGGKGKTFAENILAEIVKIGQNSRGAKTKKNIWGKDCFAFIRNTNAPAVIIECAFIDNKTDLQIIDTEAEQEKMGIAIAKGILNTFGISYVEDGVEKSKNDNKTVATDNGVLNWQKSAIADGFKFPLYGADGVWGSECESVAKKAICKKSNTYKNKNLTKIVQKAVGVEIDGKFGKDTKAAVMKWQNLMGLTDDGIVGINTWKKILGV